jgi:hypothetical protein
MAGTWTSERFPQFKDAIQRLTQQHRELEDEPLHLAIAYSPPRDTQDIFLFEVIGNEAMSINPDRNLYEVSFTPTSGFPMDVNQRLHLILTTSEELQIALQENWPLAVELAGAIRARDYQILYEDDVGKRCFKKIKKWINLEAKRVQHG